MENIVININLGNWNSVFAVPSKVVDEGLKFSDGVKLKVLLYVLRSSGNASIDEKAISDATGVNITDIPEALEYWVNMGILAKSGEVYSPAPKSESEVCESKTEVEKIAEGVDEKKRRFSVTRPQKPDYVYTAQRLAADEELGILVNEAQGLLGKTLSNSDVATLLMLKDTCGLPLDVILMLIGYCISIGKGNMRSIDRLGIEWADNGVYSVEAADNRIRMAKQASVNFSIVSQAFELKNIGSPTKKQLEYSGKWVGDWKFSPEMLREAYERCVDAKGEAKFSYIDGILKRWHAQNIKTLAELKAAESKPQAKAGKRTASYDIDELDKFNTLDEIK